jgi:hypothetical protein
MANGAAKAVVVAEKTPSRASAKGGSAVAAKSFAPPPRRAPGRSNQAIQAKLAVGPVDDPLEREADAVADAVVGGRLAPPVAPGAPSVQRKCDACEEEEPAVRRKEDAGGSSAAQTAPPAVQNVLRAPGQPLDAATRRYFEPRFGRDFGDVRVHTGGDAERSALAIGARAYTAGADIVFGSREFAPQTQEGRGLLAHELTHVLQQRGSPQRISRAPITVGNVTAQSDYKDVEKVPVKGQLAAIKKKHLAYVKAPMDPAVETQVTGFSEPQQKWLLFAIDLLLDNDKLAPGLDHAKAEQALLAEATSATAQPGAPADAFEQEVFLVSGWSQEAVSGALKPPTAADLAVTDPLYNPPSATPATPAAPKTFDKTNFVRDLLLAAKIRIIGSPNDPSNWQAGKRTQSLSQVKSVADVVQEQARTFFSPYVETVKGNRFAAGKKYSSQIESVTTDNAGKPRTVDAQEREDLARNRTESTGRDTTSPPANKAGQSIFSRTNYDPKRDSGTFDLVIGALLKDSLMVQSLDDQARHTGHLQRSTLNVAISTEVDAGIPECTQRWVTIRTLAHELMHSLAHPDFLAAQNSTTRFPQGVDFKQVLAEGFPEVLGVQLFADLLKNATAGSRLLTDLTQGLTGNCAAPTGTPTPGYKEAGVNAEAIRAQVLDDKFRAAYFHGRTALVGL